MLENFRKVNAGLICVTCLLSISYIDCLSAKASHLNQLVLVSQNSPTASPTVKPTLKPTVKDILGKEDQFTQELILKYVQAILTAIVVTFVPTIVSWRIQNQTVEIERLKNEAVYLKDFSAQALQDDIAQRFIFAKYLAIVAHSKESRQRWKTYSEEILKVLNEEKSLQEDILELKKKRNELQSQIKSDVSQEENTKLQEEADKLSVQITEKMQDLRDIRRQNFILGNPNSIVALSGEIFSEQNRFRVRNLNIEDQGDAVWLKRGGTVSATLEINHDRPQRGSAINQIIVGIGGEEKAQACVWNGLQTSDGWKIVPFVLTISSEPGTYYVRTRYAQAYSSRDALGWWKVDRPDGPTSDSNIGVVIVTDSLPTQEIGNRPKGTAIQ